jgi:hypothetical protein
VEDDRTKAVDGIFVRRTPYSSTLGAPRSCILKGDDVIILVTRKSTLSSSLALGSLPVGSL